MTQLYIFLKLVYDRHHYFGLGPIPKPKPELANTFGQYHKDTKTTSQRQNLLTDNVSIIKGTVKQNLLANDKYL